MLAEREPGRHNSKGRKEAAARTSKKEEAEENEGNYFQRDFQLSRELRVTETGDYIVKVRPPLGHTRTSAFPSSCTFSTLTSCHHFYAFPYTAGHWPTFSSAATTHWVPKKDARPN